MLAKFKGLPIFVLVVLSSLIDWTTTIPTQFKVEGSLNKVQVAGKGTGNLRRLAIITRICLFVWLAASSLLIESSASTIKQLRTYLRVTTPVDPLHLKSMAEYDYSLLLFRSWMTYDGARKAEPGLISSWTFDQGTYTFHIADQKWSDGSKLKSSDFIKNLERLFASKTTYGFSLFKIIDKKSLKIISDSEFSFQTTDKKPSEALFNQLGSVFLSLVPPSEINAKTLKLESNKISIGPYVMTEETADTIRFKKILTITLPIPRRLMRLWPGKKKSIFLWISFARKKLGPTTTRPPQCCRWKLGREFTTPNCPIGLEELTAWL